MSSFTMRKTGLVVFTACLSLTLTANAQAAPSTSDVHLMECAYVPPTRDITVTQTVHRVGTGLGVSERVMLAGFEAGWVESRMNNLDCGDADSLGVFQQRPSQGWGTPEEIMNPTYAATKFFVAARNSEASHPGYTSGQIAQDVQRSAHPERYDQAEGTARTLLAEVRALVVTGKVYDNIRYADGSWQGARIADNGGTVSQTAVTGASNGDTHLFTLNGGKVHHNIRFASGAWQGPGIADNGGSVSQIAAAATPNGDVHLFTLNGGKVHHNVRRASGTWQGPGIADNGGRVFHIALTGMPNGELHLETLT